MITAFFWLQADDACAVEPMCARTCCSNAFMTNDTSCASRSVRPPTRTCCNHFCEQPIVTDGSRPRFFVGTGIQWRREFVRTHKTIPDSITIANYWHLAASRLPPCPHERKVRWLEPQMLSIRWHLRLIGKSIQVACSVAKRLPDQFDEVAKRLPHQFDEVAVSQTVARGALERP